MDSILDELQPASAPAGSLVDPADPRVRTLLQDLPGNILRPHGREFTRIFFVAFPDSARANGWLATHGSRITTAGDQIEQSRRYRANPAAGDGGVFVGIYLTGRGAALLATGAIPDDPKFTAGIDDAHAHALGDGPDDAPRAHWDPDLRDSDEHPIHAVVLFAFDEAATAAADELERSWIQSADRKPDPQLVLRSRQSGSLLYDSADRVVEHFGFADGPARMTFLQSDPPAPVAAHWDNRFPLRQALVPLKNDPTRCGAFVVFRKLEQNVRLFRTETAKIARGALGSASTANCAYAEAMLVGRFRDGTPVALQNAPGLGPVDDFNYAIADDAGMDMGGKRCPFHAHIRKMNPRGDHEAPRDGAPDSRSRLPVRRSVTYGRRHLVDKRVLPGDVMPPAGEPVGLLFLAYVRSIEEQFVHLMLEWANSGRFPFANSGLDPVLGRTASNTINVVWPKTDDSESARFPMPFASCVTPRGGLYLFAPPRSFFAALARDPGAPFLADDV